MSDSVKKDISVSSIKKKKVFLIIGVTLMCICIVCVSLFFMMKQIGKSTLASQKNAFVEGMNIDGYRLTDNVTYQDEEYVYDQNLINILVLGVDNSNPISMEALPGDLGQTDAMYLLSLNKETNEVRIIGIPRDTMVPVSIMNNENELSGVFPMQITVQYAYGNNVENGSKLSSQAVSSLLGNIPIHKVCVINWDTVALLNDAIGGVTVTIQESFTDESGMVLAPEFYQGNTVTLKGEQAWLFVKERDCNVFGSAMTRVSNQEEYMNAFLDQAKDKFKSNPFLPFDMCLKIINSDCYYSDLSIPEYVYMISQVSDFQIAEENMMTIPGEVEKGMQYNAFYDREVETGFEEFHTDENELKEFVLTHFYKKVH